MEDYKNTGGEPAFLAWHLMALSEEEYRLDTQISLSGETIGGPKGKSESHQTDVDYEFRDSVKYRRRLIWRVIKNASQNATDYFRFDHSHVGHFFTQIAKPLLASFEKYSDPAITDYAALLDEFRYAALTTFGDNDQTQNVRIDQAQSPWDHSQTENTAKDILDDLNTTNDLLPAHITTRDLGGFLPLTPVQVISEPSDPQGRLLLWGPTRDGDPAVPALKEAHRAVVLGDPGSGKTTILKLLAIDELMESQRTTVFLELHRLAGRLREIDGDAPVRHHASAINEILFSNISITIPASQPARRNDVKTTPQQQLAILDGLDEVPPGSRQLVTDFIERIPEEWDVVVGSRAVDYEPLQGNWEEFTVDVLTLDSQTRFLDIWFRNNLESRSSIIARQTLRDIDVPRLPIFTTLIAKVARPGNEPSNSYDLYNRYVEQFLQQVWRESSRVNSQTTMMELWDVAETIAWQMWNSGMKSGPSGLGVPASYKKLASWIDKPSYPTLEQLVRKTGLLVPDKKFDTPLLQEYRWIHQSFGEFLTGHHLGSQIQSGDWSDFIRLCHTPASNSNITRYCFQSLPPDIQDLALGRLQNMIEEGDPGGFLQRPHNALHAIRFPVTKRMMADAAAGPGAEPALAAGEEELAHNSERNGDGAPRSYNAEEIAWIERYSELKSIEPDITHQLIELMRVKRIGNFTSEEINVIHDLMRRTDNLDDWFNLMQIASRDDHMWLLDLPTNMERFPDDLHPGWLRPKTSDEDNSWVHSTMRMPDRIVSELLRGKLGDEASFTYASVTVSLWEIWQPEEPFVWVHYEDYHVLAKTGIILEGISQTRLMRVIAPLLSIKNAAQAKAALWAFNGATYSNHLQYLSVVEALAYAYLHPTEELIPGVSRILSMDSKYEYRPLIGRVYGLEHLSYRYCLHGALAHLASHVLRTKPVGAVLDELTRIEELGEANPLQKGRLARLSEGRATTPSLQELQEITSWASRRDQLDEVRFLLQGEAAHIDDETISWIINETEILGDKKSAERIAKILYESYRLETYRDVMISRTKELTLAKP